MKTLLFFLFLGLSLNVSSQTIVGQVVDAENEPVEFASVRLFSQKDSTVIDGIYTSETGKFELSGMELSSYYLVITFTGLETWTKSLIEVNSPSDIIDLGTIIMTIPASIKLDEAVVVGSLDALKAGIDKKVYSVDEDISVQGGTVNDVLRNIPSIDVDEDGNISLRGDGNVTILVDGRPSALALGDGENLLDAFPANAIERIEVVTNPSAKYDPDGTSGIINIVLKKSRRRGINGVISGTVATGNLAQVNAGLSYRNQHMNAYANYSLDYYEGYRNNENRLYQLFENDSSNYLSQERDGTDYKMTNTLVFGSDIYLNDRNVLGASVSGSMGSRIRTGDLMNILYDDDSTVYRQWRRISEDPRDHDNFDANVNFTHSFKEEKGELSFVAAHSLGKRDIEGIYSETYLITQGLPSEEPQLDQRLYNDRSDKILTLQSDMNLVFDTIRARIEFGAKYIQANEENNTYSESRDSLNGVFMSDTLANFNYRYTEKVASIYGIFGQELGRFKYQVGFRGEMAEQLPQLVSSDTSFPINYLNIYPSAHLKYETGKKTEISLSYSRRINRPSSRQLNPFKSYANPMNVRTGNPELQPEYIDSYDAGFSFNGKISVLSLSTYHRRTTDVIQRVRVYYPDNSSVLTYQNVDRSNSTGFESIFIFKPFIWMKQTLSFNASHVNYEDDNQTFDWNNDGFNWSMKYIGSFEFWKRSATAQVNFQYRSPMVRPQGIVQPRTGVDLSIEKRFLKNKLSVSARVTDVFNTKGFYLELTQPGIWQTSEYKWLTRRFYLICSYKFGSYEEKKRREVIENEGGE